MSEISKSGEDLIERQITAAQIREDNIDPVDGPLLKSVNNIRQYDFDTNKDRVFTPLGDGLGYVQIAEVEPELVTTSNIGTNISIPFPKHMDSNGLNEYYANVGKHGKKVAEEVRDTVVTGVSKGVDMFTDMASDFLGKYIQVKFDPNMFDGKSMPEINPKQILMESVGFEGLDLSAFEPETPMGQYTSDIAAYIVAGTLTPGGSGSLASKALIKDVGALLSTGPELGNIFTAMEALGLENEIVSFFNAYMENPDNASADERLASRIKATIDAPLFAAALFVASKTLGKRAFKLAASGLTGTALSAQEAEGMGSGPLGTFVKNSLKQGVKQVDNLPQPGAVNQVDNTVYQRNDKGDLVPIGERRVGTTGQYVGAPPGIDSPEKMTALRQSVFDLAEQGAQGRMWYERSGKAILDAVGGNVEEADKLIQAIAITSPGTPVKANFDYALQAYSQYKAGKPILTGRFPTAMGKKLEEVFAGKEWAGRKTDDFYNNLMTHIDPSRVGPVTGDIWMLRAFGFDKANEMPSPRQYELMTLETQKIAKKLGWQPHQVQASIWVATKARDEGLDLSKAAFDYSDALQGNLAQISWESIPGATGKHMPEMFSAPYEQQAEYHVSLSKVFLDDNGSDIIANRLGIPSPGDFEAPGYFEGKVSPGTQTELAVPRKYKGAPYGEIEPAALELMNAYAAIRGVTMKQDGVGYHRPFWNPKKKDTSGILIDVGRAFTEQETDILAKKLAELSGHTEYNPIGSREGVRIINFDYLGLENKEFIKLVENAVENSKIDANVRIGYFNSQNGYLGNDWSVNKNGEDYIRGVSERGSSDLYRKVRTIIEEIQPRVDEIDADFAERYGWSVNAELNAGYRPGAKPEVTE